MPPQVESTSQVVNFILLQNIKLSVDFNSAIIQTEKLKSIKNLVFYNKMNLTWLVIREAFIDVTSLLSYIVIVPDVLKVPRYLVFRVWFLGGGEREVMHLC